ncbi:MAG: alpha/beta hydrolase fold domain-containing protein [Myxococcota bacterium]
MPNLHTPGVAPTLFLIASLIGAAFTVTAWVRVRRLGGPGVFGFFMAGWLTSELALHHIAWQALATLIFAGFGALASWPGVLGLAITFASWAGLGLVHARSLTAAEVAGRVLREIGVESTDPIAVHELVNPFKMSRPGVARISDIRYGDPLPGDKGARNLLDIVEPTRPGSLRPVLVQIHGGGWIFGEKHQQGQPLMHFMAMRDWICFAPNYRLGPRATFPAQIVDVKRALAWVRDHAQDYGGDPDFICITGGSAGGHLAALAALTAGDPGFQPGFEEADTRVSACVPFYGVFDLLDRHGVRGRASMEPFLEQYVFKCSPAQDPELWESASPISRIHENAPPFLVVQGSQDSLVFVEEARTFVEALREKSRNPVFYAEFPGAQHAFDTFHSLRCAHAIRIAAAFLERVHAQYREGKDASRG